MLMNTRRNRQIILVTALVFFLTACGWGAEKPPTPTGTYPVDPVFQQFYAQLGGQSTLGPAISPVFRDQDKIYQYVVAGLLEYDSQAPLNDRVRLAPIGRDMGITELPGAHPEDTARRLVDGYLVFDKFIPLFDRLGGEQVTGKPLTEAYKNPQKNRYEQYFENLGFYWYEGDEDDAVYLLSYGDWKCGYQCRYPESENSAIKLPSQSFAPFREKAAQLGLEFTGYAQAPPQLRQDGLVEQAYENLIMLVNLQSPQDVHLLPLPEMVGIAREAPNSPLPAPGMEFIKTEDNLGYNVPNEFDEYIRLHGGLEFVGQPITHLARPDSQTLEQCFTNLCLRGKVNEDGILEVRPIPLGARPEPKPAPLPAGPSDAWDFTMQIWETYPLVAPQQEQEIGVIVMSGGEPVPGISVELTLRLPSGKDPVYQLPPTDENGETQIILEPLMTENGTLVPYKACAQLQNQQKFCVMDSFLVWQTDYIQIATPLVPEKTSYLPFVVKNIHLYVPAFISQYVAYLPSIRKNP
jgi:hypothetical protein